MSLARTVALALGAAYVVVAIFGFIPPLVLGMPPMEMPSASGSLIGIFPINAVHNVVHLLIGGALLYGATATPTAILVSRVVGVVYIAVGLLGIPFPDGFGLLPLGGTDILLHLATGALLVAIGFALPAREGAATV